MSRTRHRPNPTQRPRRTVAAAARATFAACALLVLMLAPPLLLIHVIGNPVGGFARFSATKPLTDAEVKDILALVIWLAWAQLLACLISETAAQVRALAAPTGIRLPTRVPLTLGIQQKLARQLVVAVIAFVSLSPNLTTASTTSTATLGPVATASYQAQPATAAPGESPGTVVVHAGQDLESIAQTHLGSAQRWPAIWELNRGSAQPDGQRFTDPDLIRPGWTLRLPTPSDSLDAAPHGDYVEVTVQPGESLWSLAETHLGAGERYHEIWKLTAGLPQPDGRDANDPAKIRPGWIVRIPAAAVGAATTPNGSASTPAPGPRATTDASAPEQATPDDAAPPTTSPQASPATTPIPEPNDPTAPRPTPAVTPQHASADHADHSAGDSDVMLQGTGLGLTAIAAAAVVGAVGRRRIAQQRHRRIGRRIAMPDGDIEAAELELRVTEDSELVRLLDLAARSLILTCEQTGETFPPVAVVRLFHRGVELLLTEPAPAISPFIAAGSMMWRFDAATAGHLLADENVLEGHDIAFPFPLLVTIGLDERGPVLVNLEAAGALTVVGDHAHTQPVLNAAAAELCTSELSAMASVQLVDVAIELAAATEPNRAETHHTVADALIAPARYRADTTRALQPGAYATMHEARTRGAADLTFPCQVLIHAGPLTPEDRAQILASEIATPGFGTGVIVAAATAEAALPGWLLRPAAQLRLQLDPFGLTVQPQQLVADDLAKVSRLLAVSGDLGDVAPTDPAWAAAATISSVAANDRPLAASTIDLRDHPSLSLTVAPAGVAADVVDTTAPTIRVLGPVTLTGARGEDPGDRVAKVTEIAAFLVLHPGAGRDRLTEEIWPVKRIAAGYRQQLMSSLRAWLGPAGDGEPYVGLYSLHPDVRCDWWEFAALAKRGFAAGVDGLADLEAALRLVRGRPFGGVRPRTYAWAEVLVQNDITPAIRDVADAVAGIRLAAGDPAGARAAAAIGLLADPVSEQLLRCALRAAHLRGDDHDIAELIERLDRINDEFGDNDPETLELLATVQPIRAS